MNYPCCYWVRTLNYLVKGKKYVIAFASRYFLERQSHASISLLSLYFILNLSLRFHIRQFTWIGDPITTSGVYRNAAKNKPPFIWKRVETDFLYHQGESLTTHVHSDSIIHIFSNYFVRLIKYKFFCIRSIIKLWIFYKI